MDFNINLESLQQQCRICFQNGDVNIWHCKVTLKTAQTLEEEETFPCDEDSGEKSFVQLLDMFYNSEDLLSLSDEFPLLCFNCLEDLKNCYIIYEKIKQANVQLKNIYQESINQTIEEEYLIDVVEEKDNRVLNETNFIETLEVVENVITVTEDSVQEAQQQLQLPPPLNKTRHRKSIILDKNDAFIVTQFVSESLQSSEVNLPPASKDSDEEFQTTQHLLTVNLKAVEVKNLQNLESPETLQSPTTDSAEPTVYVCQYCPQAFAKSDYLKTHIHKSHVCKFCTQTFSITQDLFKHIREIHTEHKCAVCHKLLSSSTNLRHHIKRVHHINLPAKVTLLDFIKSTNLPVCQEPENEVEMLQEVYETGDLDFNTDYVWQNDDCIEMICEESEEKVI